MSAARDSIKKGLMSLIARKDATVFQSVEDFTREINKLGDWPNMPEITALAAGLNERLPWELQKDGSGLVTGRSVLHLAGILIKKHKVSDNIAVWAVEAWAIALGLKLESPSTNAPEPARAAPPTLAKSEVQDTKPTPINAGNSAGAAAYAQLAAKSRLGLIFGQDESGAIRVFASWFHDETTQQAAGLAATMVKIEVQTDRPLFSAPPAKRKTGSSAGKIPTDQTATGNRTSTGQSEAEISTLRADPSAPALKKEIKPTKPATPSPATASRAPTAKSVAAPTQNSPQIPPGKDKVYYGSAESLYNQAVQLLPGRSSKPDVPEALAILNQAAKQGSIDARRAIGIIYMKGVGIQPDFAAAANWLRLAAEAGDVEAQFHLGSLYQCGMGVEFSLEKAKNWLQRAAKQGHKEAEILLKEIIQG
ncbi:MAG: sel1 repeat family protein [Candidatus Riflebacteria bacterium]|nr:sel1 repeat family protein [Candidatus Riflebacteria bacterium]